MSKKENRKLAAILFADIQGYTSVMQSDEEYGRVLLRLFQYEIHQKVNTHHGKIINFYGDGCLCIFDSSVDAANCAVELQNSFRISPTDIKVRIGLHSGDVFFEGDNAFGDSINLASRIESLGVPGSVLISERVHRDIENQTTLSTVPMGVFSFKNVTRPMQVYALRGNNLVVPNPTDLKGTGKSKKELKPRPIWESPMFGLFTVLLIASLVWFFKYYDPNANIVSTEIKASRIAVLPFENKTSNKDLDIIGDMASDWIIQGLMYLDDVNLVGFESIQENIKYAGVGDSSNTFAARTGAQKIIKGNYYLDGNEIVFQSKIIDVKTGQLVLPFPEVRGPKDDNAKVVSELQQKFVTAFDAQNHDFSPGIAQNPPPHKAYKMFREGIEVYSENAEESRALMNQAVKMDSSFFWPYIWITASYFNQDKRTEADSVFALIEHKIDMSSINDFDKQWYIHWKALLDRDLNKAYESVLKILDRDKKQWFSNVEAGIIANNLNKPKEAVQIFEYINPDHYPQNIELDTWWYNYFAHNLFRLKRYNEAKDIANHIFPKYRKHWNYYDRLAEIFVAQGKVDSLQNIIETMTSNNQPTIDILKEFVFISERFAVQRQKEQQIAWAEKGLQWAKQQNQTFDDLVMGCLYFSAEKYAKALPLFKKAVNEKGNSWLHLSRLGSTYVKLGQTKKAEIIFKEMEEQYTKTNNPGYLIAQAHIKSHLNEKDAAVKFMKQAHQKAHAYSPDNYQNDIMFAPLQGHLSFETFVRPK